MSEWKEVRLSEVSVLSTGFPFKGEKYSSEGIRVVRGDNVTIGELRWPKEKDKRWNEPFDRASEFSLKEDDIVIGMDGSRVGYNRAQINKTDLPLLIAQRVACIRNNENSLQSFLYYLIFSNQFVKYIRNIQTGSAIPHVSLKQIGEYKFNIPSLETQHRIASILSSLDDKIAVNRRICENLEAQAQALFKHWFIDFAPFKDGKFVESELGMIPEGWKVGRLGEIADINPTRSLRKGTLATYLDMKNMPTMGSFPSTWEEKEFVGGMKFKNGDTLMARITPCLENGKVAYVNFLKDEEIAFGSTEYIVMTAKENLFPELLYTLCRFPSFVSYATKNMNGSSGRQRVSGETISNFQIVIAPNSVYETVKPLFKDYMKMICKCGFENLRLSTLRDTLLPKLMSGQIKV